jgi:hypothetical protein
VCGERVIGLVNFVKRDDERGPGKVEEHKVCECVPQNFKK